ncbi:hypothetical protein [Microbacterium rhizomatis]|uniref:Secreted protein n=1 Tax=Microbacterium rhizomatis TaxID=1631477 RepID=A0A5J5J329_9MICO|nr:hypothetical protein [Microbacterium rhizomatis]KAA9107608.1 hypothetical protein F6B43_09080 [Microbacterium rhizomatis]
MKRSHALLAGTAAVLLAVGGLSAPAYAEDPGIGDTKMFPLWDGIVAAGNIVPLPRAFTCPADFPYLERKQYSAGRLVPSGVEVTTDSIWVGVNISGVYNVGRSLPAPPTHPTPGAFRVAGWTDSTLQVASVSNWDGLSPHYVSITVSCTNDSFDGFNYDSWPDWHTGSPRYLRLLPQ